MDPHRLEGQPRDAVGVVGEEVAQVPIANGRVMPLERLPGRAGGDGVGHLLRDWSRRESRRLE